MAISTIGTDALAASAVTSTKLASGAPTNAQLPAGTLIKAQLYTDVGASTTATSFVNLNGSTFNFVPLRSSSKLYLIFTFYGYATNVAGVNSLAYFSIGESGSPIGSAAYLSAFSGSGGIGASAPCSLSFAVPNSSTNTRSFQLMGATNGPGQTTSGTAICATILEVAA